MGRPRGRRAVERSWGYSSVSTPWGYITRASRPTSSSFHRASLRSRAMPGDPETPVVMTRALVKRYGELVAVDHVDLTVPAGDVYGLLGPNGAGKTTFMRLLFGLIRPDEGIVELFGQRGVPGKVDALREVAGFVETPRFYGYLTARANLDILATLDRRKDDGRIDEVLELVDLADRAHDKVREYSYGMVQRLGVAAALMRSPRLLGSMSRPTALIPRASATCVR